MCQPPFYDNICSENRPYITFHLNVLRGIAQVSFQEWVVALINIRDAQKENLRAEQEAHADEGAAFAEWAFDGDDGMSAHTTGVDLRIHRLSTFWILA